MKKIAVVPFSDAYRNNRLFEDSSPNNLGYMFWILKELSKYKYDMRTIDMFSKSLDEVDLIVFLGLEFNLLMKSLLKAKPTIYIALESPVVCKFNNSFYLGQLIHYFDFILTWNIEFEKNHKSNTKLIRIPFRTENFMEFPSVEVISARKLVAQFSINNQSHMKNELYSTRKMINSVLSKNYGEDYHYYGRGWSANPSYKGVVKDKLMTSYKYKFLFAIENAINNEGYISEKILDAFLARTVPVYLGESNIENYIPNSCFVDFRNFSSVSELISYLENMPLDRYLLYLSSAEEFLTNAMETELNPKKFAQNVVELFDMDFTGTSFSHLPKNLFFLRFLLWSFFHFVYRKLKCTLHNLGFMNKKINCYRN